jgi:hypothetical protein
LAVALRQASGAFLKKSAQKTFDFRSATGAKPATPQWNQKSFAELCVPMTVRRSRNV